jgi:hypothetical protein
MSLQVVSKEEIKVRYEPQLLSTKELIDKYWGACVPLLDQCIKRAMHGEMLVEDLYTRALKGEVFVIVAKNDDMETPTVKLVIVLELVTYPRFTAMNVVALGGKDLKNLIQMYWKDVCSWAKVCGVKKIECSVHPAMERILTAEGFERTYVQLRQDLTEV